MRFVCKTCGYARDLPETPKVRCRCGTVYRAATQRYETDALAKPARLPRPGITCRHIGSKVGTADCDCHTKPRVYACELHGLCLPRMAVTAAVANMDDGTRATVSRCCMRCEDYATPNPTT